MYRQSASLVDTRSPQGRVIRAHLFRSKYAQEGSRGLHDWP
ncbi:hypothetical protein [Ruegeria arenilitoris]|nr:hypothetical protein [Ruegeria arenilitoris]